MGNACYSQILLSSMGCPIRYGLLLKSVMVDSGQIDPQLASTDNVKYEDFKVILIESNVNNC